MSLPRSAVGPSCRPHRARWLIPSSSFVAARPRLWGRSGLVARTHDRSVSCPKVASVPRMPSPARPHSLGLAGAGGVAGRQCMQCMHCVGVRRSVGLHTHGRCGLARGPRALPQGRGCGLGRGLTHEARRRCSGSAAVMPCVRVPSPERRRGLGLAAAVVGCSGLAPADLTTAQCSGTPPAP